jgi:hypothetical protein
MQRFTLGFVAALAIAVAACNGGGPTVAIDGPAEPAAGGQIDLRFTNIVDGRATDKHWIVFAPAGAPDDYAEGRIFVDSGTSAMRVAAPKSPGHYELRLHRSWPARTHHVVGRVPLTLYDVVGTR